MASQLEQNVEHLKETIKSLSKPPINLRAQIEAMLMSQREIAEEYTYVTSGYKEQDEASGGNDGRKTAHLIVYGTPPDFESLDDIDPDDKTVYDNAMKLDSALGNMLEDMKEQFLQALDVLSAQAGALVQNVAELGTEAGMAAAATAGYLATIPPNAGGAAFAMFNFNAKILTLATSLSPLMMAISPLGFLQFFVVSSSISAAEAAIDSVVVMIDTNLQAISNISVPMP